MDTKNYLSQLWHINKRIELKLDELSRLRSMTTKVTATFSDMPRSATRNVHRLEDAISRLIDLEEEINNDIDRFVDLKNDIMETIKSIEYPQHRLILEMRYIHQMSFDKICNELFYSPTHVYRLHNEALYLFELNHRKRWE